jgi:hypothetical protein
MGSDEVARLLHDVRLNRVAAESYSRKTLASRIVLLLVLLLRTAAGRR